MKEVHDFGSSVKAKLLNISRSENQGYQTIVTRFFQERLLYRLSVSRYKDRFFLKGGALLYAHERFMARPTLDIDFLGHRIGNDRDNIIKAFAEICSIPYAQDGTVFYSDTLRADDIAVENKYPGVRLTLTAALGTIRQNISIDIGFGDVITPRPAELDYPNLIEGFPDTNILAYSLETVVAEKFQTMIARSEANSRMKDFYDVFVILKEGRCDRDTLCEAIKATFENRGTSYVDNHAVFSTGFADSPLMSARWRAFARKIAPELSFQTVMSRIQSDLKPYWENLKVTH